MPKGRILINDVTCKGCTLCVTACPSQLIHLEADRLNARGYHPALFADPGHKCTGCNLCAVMCPDACITVFRSK